MFPEHKEIIVTLKKKNNHFATLCSQYNAIDKAIILLGNNFEDLLVLQQLQLDIKDKILILIKEEQENKTPHQKSLSMEGTCTDWDNLEQDDFAN
ncbi:YdcH family protein [Photobacterium andalusiense]|uniref:Uncharacterized protein n=1 Tax=Photobacterium andalusiense TaxID=2204296 RepID=A0A1Y6M9J1_9GAMM|nr:hypothetical protein [Photobacterium andalusiense]SMY33204.1 hypothetical protein PAND9192_00817 [Photobacterium andalusiense]